MLVVHVCGPVSRPQVCQWLEHFDDLGNTPRGLSLSYENSGYVRQCTRENAELNGTWASEDKPET